MKCLMCDREIEQPKGRGRKRTTCGQRCRKRLSRAGVPARMMSVNRWVRADGKRPITIDGKPASSTRETTWSSYREVRASEAGDGFGIMLGGGLAAHDLDDCFTDAGELKPWARDVLESVHNPLFIEVSKSGEGLHIFVEAEEGPGKRTEMPGGGRWEFYSRDQFIRTTLDRYVTTRRPDLREVTK